MNQNQRQNARTEALENVAKVLGRAASGRAERDSIRAELGLPTSVQVRGTVVDAVAKAAGYERRPRRKPAPSRNEAPDVFAAATSPAGIGGGLALAGLAAFALFFAGKR